MKSISEMKCKFLIVFAVAALAALLYAPSPGLAVPILGNELASFVVLGGQGVTNVPPSTIGGNLGSAPNGSIGGGYTFTAGGPQSNTPLAISAQGELITAISNLNGMSPSGSLGLDLTGLITPGYAGLAPGVYTVPGGGSNLTGTLTLDGKGDPNAVWVFQMASTLITSSGSVVNVINTGSGAGVYWDVRSSATLGTNSIFMGNILALTSITMTTGATDLCGRLLAENGAVTLDHNTISGICTGILAGSGGLDQGNTHIPAPNTPPVVVPPVPEPSTLLLLGSGLAGLVPFRKRFFKKA